MKDRLLEFYLGTSIASGVVAWISTFYAIATQATFMASTSSIERTGEVFLAFIASCVMAICAFLFWPLFVVAYITQFLLMGVM